MCELEDYSFEVGSKGSEIRLRLRRRRQVGGKPVLLLHGASARSETFEIPRPDERGPRCLADWLHLEGFEPWLLDWRGSGEVVDRHAELVNDHPDLFNFDLAASLDVPVAIARILAQREADHDPVQKLSVVGHCLGAGVLCQAIARGHVDPERLDHVVLLTLGLFYEPPWDGRIKSADHVLERLWLASPRVGSIDPRPSSAWPAELEEIYRNWPEARLLHPRREADPVQELCDRLTFMYGAPYMERRLVPAIHSENGPESLASQFGPIPLAMYLQGAANVRRGWAGPFSPLGVQKGRRDVSLVDDNAARRFAGLEAVTLVTGSQNRLWHPRSVEKMHEWLVRGRRSTELRRERRVLPGYGHQDLLWGAASRAEVFPHIRNGLPKEDGASADAELP